MTHNQLERLLGRMQKYCRVRKLKPSVAVEIAKKVALFLVDSPPGTHVMAGLHAHLPSSYNHSADATYIAGWVSENGEGIRIIPRRDSGGFGARYAKISVPDGFKLIGPTVHRPSGAVGCLDSTRVVPDERFEGEEEPGACEEGEEEIAEETVDHEREVQMALFGAVG